MKISGIYKITNLETNECYVGSSVDVKTRWTTHKAPSRWKQCPNNKLYIDFQQYGLDKFVFEILEETDNLKEREQYYIGLLKPSYNSIRANGRDIEKYKEYEKTERRKEYRKKCQKEYSSQLCNYNGEILTLNALSARFARRKIPHPVLEAKKYLIQQIE